jgi:hypothetical protein
VPWNLPEDHPQLIFIPFEQAELPPPVVLNGGGYNVIEKCWWIVHPEKGLVVYVRQQDDARVPQCNPNEMITKFMVGDLMGDWAEARYIPKAFIRADL